MSYELDLSGMAGSRFTIAYEDGKTVVEVGGDGVGVEAAAWGGGKGRGKIMICGLSLIADWDKTPAARWLLADMLRFR